MRILVTSDLHSNKSAFSRFAATLKEKNDFGIMAGDLIDDSITLNEVKKTLSLEDDDLLEELYDPEDSVEDLDSRIKGYKKDPESLLSKTLQAKEDGYRGLLELAGKRIFLLRGNHDRSRWSSGGNIININLLRYELGHLNIVGFEYTRLFTSEEDELDLIRPLIKMVDRRTLLVTHAPAYGILDRNYRGISIGSKPILDLVRQCKPAFHIFGHVHDSSGIERTSINASYPKKRCFFGINTEAGQNAVRQIDENPNDLNRTVCNRC